MRQPNRTYFVSETFWKPGLTPLLTAAVVSFGLFSVGAEPARLEPESEAVRVPDRVPARTVEEAQRNEVAFRAAFERVRAGRVIAPDPDAKYFPPDTDRTSNDPRVGPPIGGAAYVEQGPQAAVNGQASVSSGKVVGACNALACHSTNPDVIYAGFVNGGVWKTTNATAADPTWTPQSDGFGSLSIGALEFDPTDASGNTVVAGIGLNSSLASIGGARLGILRTSDGTSWTLLSGGGFLADKNINGIAARGSVIVASIDGATPFLFGSIGIARSTNGGASFTVISGSDPASTAPNGLPGGTTYDLASDPTNNAVLYTAVRFAGSNDGIYKSTNTGATWARVSDSTMNALLTDNTPKVEISVGTSNNVYVAIVGSNSRLADVFRSGDGGATWASMGVPTTTESNSVSYGIHVGGQGYLHLSIVADRSNANVVYVGGDRQPWFAETGSVSQNSIGAQNYTGRLFRGDASIVTNRWQHLTNSSSLGTPGGGTASNTGPHADSRDMAMDASGRVIEGDDGGVYRRTNPQNNTGDWSAIVGTTRATECHDMAYDSVSNKIITGNQDNGNTQQGANNPWESVSQGDGGDVAVDDVTLAITNQSVRYTSAQNLGGMTRRTYNSAGTQTASAACALALLNGSPTISAQFVTPIELNKLTPTRLLIGAANGVYESLDQGNSCTRVAGLTLPIGDGLSGLGLAYGGTQGVTPNPDVIYAVSRSDDTHVYVRTTAAGSLTASAALPKADADDLLDVTLNSSDYQNAFVIDTNQVFRTTNGGANWTDITGNLTGVGLLKSIEFVPISGGGNIVVGTQTGVYTAKTSAATSWNRVGTNMPAGAYVFDLEYDATDNVLVAGTLGRGVWLISNAAAVVSGSAVGEWKNY